MVLIGDLLRRAVHSDVRIVQSAAEYAQTSCVGQPRTKAFSCMRWCCELSTREAGAFESSVGAAGLVRAGGVLG